MSIEKCAEGGEGIIITPKNNNLIYDDVTRCTNQECPVKEQCSRFLQTKIDGNTNNNFYYAEFPNIPAYTLDNPQESYDARKNCDKFIQYETSNNL